MKDQEMIEQELDVNISMERSYGSSQLYVYRLNILIGFNLNVALIHVNMSKFSCRIHVVLEFSFIIG